MWGTVVTSLIMDILNPRACNALRADSRPGPGPLINILIFLSPCSIAFCPASSATSFAAKGVLFLEPLNFCTPELDHAIVLPFSSEIVTIVLLKVDWMCTTPEEIFLLTRFLATIF